MRTTVLIPAYQPSERLVGLVASLQASDVDRILVVDDGSGPDCAPIFEAVAGSSKVGLHRHAVNLGKGAALKTGLNAALCEDPTGLVVTADADGQHLPEDVLRVAEQGRARPEALVLGVRAFDGDVPWRSRFGNAVTRHVLRAILGYALADTQTGLRAIPAGLAARLLRVPSRGYEFELDMLIACKRAGVPVVQTPIRTVYLDQNASSHFNPLLDSMRIYFALLRFLVASLATALIDNFAFAVLFALVTPVLPLRAAILASQGGARLVAMAFNYATGRQLVFASRRRHAHLVPKYVLLVVAAGAISYMGITFLVETVGLRVMVAKVLVEGALFLPNFVVQRDLIFGARGPEEGTEAAA